MIDVAVPKARSSGAWSTGRWASSSLGNTMVEAALRSTSLGDLAKDEGSVGAFFKMFLDAGNWECSVCCSLLVGYPPRVGPSSADWARKKSRKDIERICIYINASLALWPTIIFHGNDQVTNFFDLLDPLHGALQCNYSFPSASGGRKTASVHRLAPCIVCVS